MFGGGGGGGGVVSGFGFGLRSLCGGVGKVLLLLLSVLGPYFVSCWRVASPVRQIIIIMRSVLLAFRGGGEAALARHHRWRHYSLRRHPPRFCARRNNVDVWRPRRGDDHHSFQRCISAAASAPPDDSFHGISLDMSRGGGRAQADDGDGGDGIREAEVVTSEEDRRITRALIEEATRAAMSAHRPHRAGERDDGASSSDDNGSNRNYSGPYGRRLRMLDEARRLHRDADARRTLEYARSCMAVGELQYELGRMDDSQDMYTTALQQLMTDVGGDDCGDEGRGGLAARALISQCMHSLGSIHARCGEYEEAYRWYDGALKRKTRLIDDVLPDGGNAGDDATIGSICHHRYELGKTFNGLAALEAIWGGDERWEKAMSLFREAERNYLHGLGVDKSSEEGIYPLKATGASSTEVTKAVIRQMTPRSVESLINVRSNMGELLRQRGQYEDAAEMIASALNTARLALEDAHERAATTGDDGSVSTDIADGPSLDEQRNAIVDLIIQNAGMFMSANRFDEAAEAYERALSSHVYFRRWSEGNGTLGQLPNKKTVLPAKTSVSTKPPKLDLTAATKIEATIRRNLADALAQIGQDNLSLEHYAASLAIKRHIGGDLHLEVAHTLMDMGALTGGPLRDFAKALNCFKEALYIYRTNLEECSRANGINGDDRNANSSVQTFFDDEHTEEINRSVEKALKNISLIDAALLKDRDGATSKKRR